MGWPGLERRRWLVAIVLLAAVAVACGELEPPEAFSPTTSSTTPASPEQDAEAGDGAVQEAVGPTEEFVPTADPDYVPTLLVASDQPVIAVDGPESSPLSGPLTDLQATALYDDLVGGVVAQESSGAIVYRQSQLEPEVLDPGGSTLLGVGFWEGTPRAFVQSAPGRVDWIQLVTTGSEGHTRRTHFELDEGEEIVSFSASRDIQAVVVQDDACGEIRFYGSDGEPLALRGPTPPPCTFPGRPSFGTVALSPDGGALAYTIVTYETDGTEKLTELQARELGAATGGPFFELRVGEELAAVTSLTFDGRRVAYLRAEVEIEADSQVVVESVTLLDLTPGGSELSVDLLEAADVYSLAFVRVPLDDTVDPGEADGQSEENDGAP